MSGFLINVFLFFGLAFGILASADSDWHMNVNADDLTPESLIVLPGAFELDDSSKQFRSLCLPSQGRWVRAGKGSPPCPLVPGTTSPPPKETFKLGSGPEGTPAFVIANLGISSEQWARIKGSSNRLSGGGDDTLQRLDKAVGLVTTDHAVRWTFRSALLPESLEAEIPGSGVFFHVQNRIRDADEPFLFRSGGTGLLIEAKLGLPELTLTGGATSVVTIGVTLQTEDASGRRAALPIIVGLAHSRGDVHEGVSSDGRNMYIQTALVKDASFIIPVAGKTMFSSWPGRLPFSFEIRSQSVARLLQAVNESRARRAAPLMKTDLSLVRLKQVDLRNENRFLDTGSVAITLDTEYLRARTLHSDSR